MTRPRLGCETAFRMEPADDHVFAWRLVCPGIAAGGWIVLSYRAEAGACPPRPVLRLALADGSVQDHVLPGLGTGRAHWLGLLPRGTRTVWLALAPGLCLERVGRRGHLGVLAECVLRRPSRALAALYEGARGDARRYRDILRGACAVTPARRWPDWAAARGADEEVPAVATRLHVLVAGGSAEAVSATLASLGAQSHRNWTAIVVADGVPDQPGVQHRARIPSPARERGPVAPPTDSSSSGGDPRIASQTWDPNAHPADLLGEADALLLLEPGDALEPDALALLAAGLPRADLVYADSLGPDGVRLKPDWSPDLALASGYHGRPLLAARALLARLPDAPLGPLPGLVARLELALATACAGAHHVPRVLARTAADPPPAQDRAALLGSHLAAAGSPARAVVREGACDLLWPLPEPAPLASIVIPSRDRLDLIARVCRGVLHETAYPGIELVVVDNGSTDAGVLAHYDALRRDPRVRIVPYPHPFNFSAMVNRGVAAATGRVVVLLNNDVAVLRPDWLEALVRQAVRPEVGAVGAKLLYGDGRLQHAGVVVGLGGRAGHILRRRPGDSPGRLGRLRVAHEVSAVTAACLAVERAKYEAVGGFDEDAFPVDFNDVDVCLRLARAGFKTVWTPAATLAHLESTSRGPARGAERLRFEAEGARFSERWRAVLRHDPFHHPSLSLTTFGEELE